MLVYAACILSRRVPRGCCRRWCAAPQPLVHIRSASAAEPGTRRSNGEQLWEAVSYIPFSRARLGSFFQEQPVLRNPFLEDALLRGYLRRHLPQEVIISDLCAFGERVANEVDMWGRECEVTPPQLVQFDPWGRRVDHIVTSPAWNRMKDLSAREGLVATGYERSFGEWSRVYQMSKLYIFSPSSGLYTCPLAMTDGAAKVIQSIGAPWPTDEAYSRLTTRQPERFWTSGQWMTERQGGSDVGHGTETVAVVQPDGSYKLHGFKWFTSATDADMTLTLARVRDRTGATTPGSRGLSLFYAEVSRDEDGRLRGIEVQRLKDKLGTDRCQLLMGISLKEGRGVASIANMLTITRIHNSVSAAAAMRRVVQLAREYATRRSTFWKASKDHPLHMQTLARMEVETRGAFLLVMDVCRLLGHEESGKATQLDTDLCPYPPLFASLQALAVVTPGYLDCVEYWEGTTNVLSLDVLRSVARSSGMVLHAYFTQVKVQDQRRSLSDKCIYAVYDRAEQECEVHFTIQNPVLLHPPGSVSTGALLIDHASWKGASPSDTYAALRWCEQDLCPVVSKQIRGCYDPAPHRLMLLCKGKVRKDQQTINKLEHSSKARGGRGDV
uniref:Acyl-CoA dehydrogenase family, member 11 n=1 Tax=Echeneis naucrates TaxID=173247 RepID=A0A665X9H6_ECHNA